MHTILTRLWNAHRLLTAAALTMLILLPFNVWGIVADPRLITGMPAWLKPAKFAFSTALYAATLAWVISHVTVRLRFARQMGVVTAVALWAEILIINLQAWRGTTSHFNFTTELNSALFAMMGISIAALWLASIGVTVALFQQPFANRPLGWALRLGLVITVLGEASGGLMTRPMAGNPSGIIGAHTVGAPDGGPTIPALGWSTDHGDLRVGHFVGLHAMQMLPLFYFFVARRRKPRTSLILVAATGYLAAFALLEWQALRGQSLLQPDSWTVAAWLAWVVIVYAISLLTPALEKKASFQSAIGAV